MPVGSPVLPLPLEKAAGIRKYNNKSKMLNRKQ
jgi:hypothetical protein